MSIIALDNPTIQDICLFGTALVGIWTARKAKQTKDEVNKVKDKVSDVNRTVDQVHTLSNSAMAAQLKMNVQLARSNAVMAHRLSEITGQAGDEAAAIAVDVQVHEHERILQEHLVQQARVDAGGRD
jgi:hypothetical protein